MYVYFPFSCIYYANYLTIIPYLITVLLYYLNSLSFITIHTLLIIGYIIIQMYYYLWIVDNFINLQLFLNYCLSLNPSYFVCAIRHFLNELYLSVISPSGTATSMDSAIISISPSLSSLLIDVRISSFSL